MDELLKITDIVEHILKEDEKTRSNNWELYYVVCKYVNPNALSSKFGTVIRSHREYGLPPFESVTRARRKIVEHHPELAGNDEVEGGRWSYEKKFREYSKVGV